jgi:predicted enzyme related to lactoylglutathione lyase
MKKRVTGIGGIFFKCNDPEKVKNWYKTHLGFDVNEYGSLFRWMEVDKLNVEAPAMTVWSPFKFDTKYFNPSDKPYMFNYRVENLLELLDVLRNEGVQIVGEVEEYSYGKFGWIMDPEGNKIELWEPIDHGFEQ